MHNSYMHPFSFRKLSLCSSLSLTDSLEPFKVFHDRCQFFERHHNLAVNQKSFVATHLMSFLHFWLGNLLHFTLKVKLAATETNIRNGLRIDVLADVLADRSLFYKREFEFWANRTPQIKSLSVLRQKGTAWRHLTPKSQKILYLIIQVNILSIMKITRF